MSTLVIVKVFIIRGAHTAKLSTMYSVLVEIVDRHATKLITTYAEFFSSFRGWC